MAAVVKIVVPVSAVAVAVVTDVASIQLNVAQSKS